MARTLPIRLRTITAAVVVIASGLIVWNAYQSITNSTDVTTATLPVIAADVQPFRVLPENPGGADIPNQGSTLYNVLNAENSDDMALDGVNIPAETAEPIELYEQPNETTGFELPDIPQKRTESLYGVIDDLKNENDVAQVDENVEEAAEDIIEPMVEDEKTELKEKLQAAIEKAEEKASTETPSLRRRPQSIENKDEVGNMDSGLRRNDDNLDIGNVIKPSKKPKYTKPKIAEKAKPITKEKPKQEFSLDRILSTPPTQKRHYIQLASVKGEDNARNAYGRIRNDFPKLVEGVSVSFPQVDLGARGVFTRIQIGPLDASEARSRCAEYTALKRGGTCLVLSR